MQASAPTVDAGAPAVVLSPHLDDAVWACFSLLAGEEPAVVATVFAGIPQDGVGWWDRECGITDSAAHVRRRRAEDAATLATLGRRALHLPLLDDQYRNGDSTEPAEIAAELRERVPAVSRVYAWAGIGHPDHVIVRNTGLALARAGVPVTLVSDYCYNTRRGWPTWIAADGQAAADEQWRDVLGDALGDGITRPRVVRLDDHQSERKLAAMKGYVTQFDNIEREEPSWQDDGLPPSDPRKRVIEVFYDLDHRPPA
jgi:LmbE family N-acetylglucosaminyl deacetylase